MGGTVLGLVLGIVMTVWIRFTLNDAILEITITFATVYLAFLIAESDELHISGTLTVVALGIFMSGNGKTYISSRS